MKNFSIILIKQLPNKKNGSLQSFILTKNHFENKDEQHFLHDKKHHTLRHKMTKQPTKYENKTILWKLILNAEIQSQLCK